VYGISSGLVLSVFRKDYRVGIERRRRLKMTGYILRGYCLCSFEDEERHFLHNFDGQEFISSKFPTAHCKLVTDGPCATFPIAQTIFNITHIKCNRLKIVQHP
jgi:hypothetical protein